MERLVAVLRRMEESLQEKAGQFRLTVEFIDVKQVQN